MNKRGQLARRVIALVAATSICMGTVTTTSAAASELSRDRDLSVRLAAIFDGTYKSLTDRQQPSGYTATSLTGEYDGMFYRDASIQANAMLAAGDADGARKILQYLIGYGIDNDLPRAPRTVPNEKYVVSASFPQEAGDPNQPVQGYESIDDSTALLKLNGPNNGAAISFVAGSSPVTAVELGLLSLTNGPGEFTVAIREERDWNAAPVASMTVDADEFYTADQKPVWATFEFEQPANLVAGNTYYITMQATTEPDAVVQLWGNQSGGAGSVRTYNFDKNWSDTDDQGLYRIYTRQGVIAESTQRQDEATTGLFQIQQPNHQAAQPFVPVDSQLDNVWLPISGNAGSGVLAVSVRTSRTDPRSEVASGQVQLADMTGMRQWLKVPLRGTGGTSIEPGQQYWLVVNVQEATQGFKTVWWGTTTGGSHVGTSWNFDQEAYSGWHAESHRLAFNFNMDTRPQHGPAYKADLTEVVATAGGSQTATFTFNSNTTVSAVDVNIGKSADLASGVTITVTDSVGREVSTVIDPEDINAMGGWHRVNFSALGRGGDGTFEVKVSAPQAAPDAVDVLGASGEAGYQAMSVVASGQASTTDQPDGNYMMIDAWARYVASQPDDTQFVDDTYELVAKWADFYLTSSYLDNDLQLMRNPQFEHSRRHYHIPTLDLMTNVFASQALHELAGIARNMPGQRDRAKKWADRAVWLEVGIKENLVTQEQVSGQSRTIYGELLWDNDPDHDDPDREGQFVKGYSWVNFAPVAANWYAIDWEVMANTYQAYLEHGAIEWSNTKDSHSDLMLMMDTEEHTWEPLDPPNVWPYERYAVIGKGLGWELMTAAHLGRLDRLATIEHFLDVHTPGNILGEFYYKQGPSDVGNQEQGSWWILGMLAAYPKKDIPQVPQPGGGGTDTHDLVAAANTAISAISRMTSSIVGRIQAKKVTIRGKARVGATLTARTSAWKPAKVTLSYRWYVNGKRMKNANKKRLVLKAKHAGKRIKVRVIGKKKGFVSAVRTSKTIRIRG